MGINKEIKLLFRDNINGELKKLRNKGAKIYSISRINNFNTCKRGYYYTYIDKKKQKDGVYSLLGSAAHEDLEHLYDGSTEELERSSFDTEWLKAELFGINFPSEKIKENYKKDMDEHYKIYKKMQGEFISELGFILKLDELHYLTGYIDLLKLREDGKVEIYDFKTSAMFKGEKLVSAGRQLIIYQEALRQLYGLETLTNGWIMLKYVEVKIGNNKPKLAVSAREWVSKCKSQIKTLMKKEGIEALISDMLLAQAVETNSIDCLPKEVQDKIKVKTYFLPYDITNELVDETLLYINNTIKEIEKIDNDIEKWTPCPNEFFCKNLCGFGEEHCKYWEFK